MKLYLVMVIMYDYGNYILDVEPNYNIYSSFEQAKQEGLKELKDKIEVVEDDLKMTFKEMLDKEMLNYDFTITEIDDLEYAENFDVEFEITSNGNSNYNNLESTHKVYYLDYNGNITEVSYEYRIKNALWRSKESLTFYPEDFEKGASEKFKIGDIVKVKDTAETEDPFDEENNKDRIYVVRYLPRKFNGEKYFENKYALISLYKIRAENKELFTYEFYEREIEKYTGKIEKESEYDLLSRILKGDLVTTWEYWDKVKVGMLPLNIESFEKENLENEDDWGFYSTALTPKKTGLPVCIFPAKNTFGINIKDYLPKLRVQNKLGDYKDTFFISLEKEPRVVIGENKLLEKDYKEVCDFVKGNLDILLKHFDPCNEFYDDELWGKLKERGLIKKEQ